MWVRSGGAPEAVAEPRAEVNPDHLPASELPDSVRLLLIAGLELCGAVMRADVPSALREQAELMFVLASEHIVVED